MILIKVLLVVVTLISGTYGTLLRRQVAEERKEGVSFWHAFSRIDNSALFNSRGLEIRSRLFKNALLTFLLAVLTMGVYVIY